MSPLVWKPEFSVGHPRLDEQHLFILNLINKIEDKAAPALLGGSEVDLWVKLVHYANMHFSCEEEILAEAGFADLRAHAEEHLEYRRILNDLGRRVADHDPYVLLDLHQFTLRWWNEHILVEDQRFAPLLKARFPVSLG